MTTENEAPGTDLMTLGEITGTLERPKGLDVNDMSGKEDIRPDEVRLPRLAIAQGLSKQIIPGEGVYIKGLSMGEMFNDVTSDIYGNGPLTVVPIKRHVTRIEFDPNQKGVPLDRDVPPGDPRLEWRKGAGLKGEDLPPLATEYVEFACLLLRPNREPEKVIVSIKTTNKFQRRAAELWTTFVMTRPGAIYAGLNKIETKIEKGKNKEGQDTLFGVFVVKNAGFIPLDTPSGAALYKYAKDFADALKGKKIETNRDIDEDPTSFDTNRFEEEGTRDGGM